MNPVSNNSSWTFQIKKEFSFLSYVKEVERELENKKEIVIGKHPDQNASLDYYEHFLILTRKLIDLFSEESQINIERNDDIHTKVYGWLTLARTYGASFMSSTFIEEIKQSVTDSGFYPNLHPVKHFEEKETFYPKKVLSAEQKINDVFCHSMFFKEANAIAALFSGECSTDLAGSKLLEIATTHNLKRQGKGKINEVYLKDKTILYKQEQDNSYLFLIGKFQSASNPDYFIKKAGHFGELRFNPLTGESKWKNWFPNMDENGKCRIIRYQTNHEDENDEAGKVHLEFNDQQNLTIIREMLQTTKKKGEISPIGKALYF